jgi:hypothetical protein
VGLIERQALLVRISPPLDHLLSNQLIDEFISAERRFIQRDWEPAELDGGQFCEILARILYHMDSGNLNSSKGFDDCIKYLEDDQVGHALLPRQEPLHLAKVLRTVYKFRSQRGAVHISPTYTPNHMDSKLVIECVRWAMNETLRLFWQGDREKVAKAIRELLQFDVPCVGVFEDVIIVQRTDLQAEEELLILLHYAGEAGFTRKELGQYSLSSAPSVTRALQSLISAARRQIVLIGAGRYRLTDLGSRRIRNELADRLLVE